MAELKKLYRDEIVPALMQELGYKNINASTKNHQDHPEHGCW